MDRYRGKYRVAYEIDKRTGKPQEFSFIPCRIKRGSNICRHNADTLNVFIPSIQIINRLLNDYDMFTAFQMGTGEGTLLFPENRLPEAALILKPHVKGKNVSPRAKRNTRFIS